MLLKRFLLFSNDVLLYSPLVKSYLCLIGLFSCSANFITRFIIPPPCIFFLLYSTKLCIPMRRTRIFSLFFICLGLDAISLHHVLSKKDESSLFRNQVALPIRFYPVCIRNSFLNSRWEIVLYFPLLDFHSILLY